MMRLIFSSIIFSSCVGLTISAKSGSWGPTSSMAGAMGKPNNGKKDSPVKEQTPAKGGSIFKKRQEREQLYEAYNLLHSLAQV